MPAENDRHDLTQPPSASRAATAPAKLSPAPESSSASTLITSVIVGVTLGGRYFVEKELGHGGIGAVYLAHDRKLMGKPVVVKVLLEDSLRNEWVVQKFQQEKEALARVDHPGIVGILDAGELLDGKPYIVMQYVDGVTLRSVMQPAGMGLERAACVIQQAGAALSAVHEKGIFHRDLKPENIMLQVLGGGDEQVKIIDFGIAKVRNSLVAPSTTVPVLDNGPVCRHHPLWNPLCNLRAGWGEGQARTQPQASQAHATDRNHL